MLAFIQQSRSMQSQGCVAGSDSYCFVGTQLDLGSLHATHAAVHSAIVKAYSLSVAVGACCARMIS